MLLEQCTIQIWSSNIFHLENSFRLLMVNSGVTGGEGQGAEYPSETSDWEISAGKREARKKGKMEHKRRKIEKGKVEN